MEQIEIKSLSLVQLKNVMIEMGEKAFRAKQIYEWLHQKQAESFDEMSNLSAASGKIKRALCTDYIENAGSADFKNRRNTEISFCPS